MIKKDIILGLFLGLISNIFGLFLVCLVIASTSSNNDDIFKVLHAATNENYIGKLISLGAVMNLICFFYLLKINNENKAAGVLSATVIVAIFTFLIRL